MVQNWRGDRLQGKDPTWWIGTSGSVLSEDQPAGMGPWYCQPWCRPGLRSFDLFGGSGHWLAPNSTGLVKSLLLAWSHKTGQRYRQACDTAVRITGCPGLPAVAGLA